MRNSNGYGGIVDLGGKRRRRYAIRITVSYGTVDEKFVQKYKYLGYYEKLKDAKQALADYNNQTHTKNDAYINITFSEAWKLWKAKNLTDETTSRAKSYNAAYKKCSAIYKMKLTDIRLVDLENIMEAHQDLSKSTLNNIKIVLNFVFDFGLQNDIIQKSYVPFLKFERKEEEHHKPFTTKEIEVLWKDFNSYKLILIYIYTGCRANELLALKKNDVNLKGKYFNITHSKTKAGIRLVPIADKIYPLFEYYYHGSSSEYVFNTSYEQLAGFYKTNIPGHTPHDTRATFVSLATAKGVDERLIQKIVGHKGGNVTRDVYTSLEIETLKEAVNML